MANAATLFSAIEYYKWPKNLNHVLTRSNQSHREDFR